MDGRSLWQEDLSPSRMTASAGVGKVSAASCTNPRDDIISISQAKYVVVVVPVVDVAITHGDDVGDSSDK